MNLSQHETSSSVINGPSETAASGGGREAWLAEQTAGLLYRDNLIYLPFASHLSEEDLSEEVFAKAA